MSIPYEAAGRTSQKKRTRDALLAAARELVGEGLTPTVEQTAARAAISRATAYRYFTTQRSLLVSAYPEIQTSSLLPPNPPDDPADRFAMAVDAFLGLVADREGQLRTMLRLSLEPSATDRPPALLRQGRGIGWIEDALSPWRGRISIEAFTRLVFGVRSAIGIEARVWLTDIAGLSGAEAMEIMRWSARVLLQTTLAEFEDQ